MSSGCICTQWPKASAKTLFLCDCAVASGFAHTHFGFASYMLLYIAV